MTEVFYHTELDCIYLNRVGKILDLIQTYDGKSFRVYSGTLHAASEMGIIYLGKL